MKRNVRLFLTLFITVILTLSATCYTVHKVNVLQEKIQRLTNPPPEVRANPLAFIESNALVDNDGVAVSLDPDASYAVVNFAFLAWAMEMRDVLDRIKE